MVRKLRFSNIFFMFVYGALLFFMSSCKAPLSGVVAEGSSNDLQVSLVTPLVSGDIGTTQDLTISILNKGSDINDLNLNLDADFLEILSTTCSVNLAKNQTCDYVVRVTLSTTSTSDLAMLTLNYGNGESATLDVPMHGDAIVTTVAPLYATNGVNWNDYIEVSNSGVSRFEQVDTACSVNVAKFYSHCVHGGELKRVDLAGVKTCEGLTIEESLGVFKWRCLVIGGQAAFYSLGLREDKHLSDLVNSSSWKSNSVTVKRLGEIIATSSSATWWGNTVEPLPDNSAGSVATLSDTGKVYTLSSSRDSGGYHIAIGAHKIAITMINGAKLNYNGDATKSCNDNFGLGSADGFCLLASQHADFLWIEGYFDGTSSTGSNHVDVAVINFYQNDHMRMRNVQITGSTGSGLTGQGLQISRTASGLYEYISAFNNSDEGITSKYGQRNNVWRKVKTYNNEGQGSNLDNYGATDYIYISDYISVSNGLSGFNTSTGTGVFLNSATVVNNLSRGAYIYAGDTVNDLLSFSNDSTGSDLSVAFGTSSITKVATSYFGDFSSTTTIDNNFIISNDIYVKGQSCFPGTGDYDSSCLATGASTATVNTNVNFFSDVVGRVVSDDTQNSSDTAGSATYPAAPLTFDWHSFEHWYRAWGMNGSTNWNDALNIGRCSSGSCGIWDLSLQPFATKLKNTSYDGINQNSTFTAGSQCPSAVDGSVTRTDEVLNVYLINAREIFNDNFGDDDGLCESNEECTYSPNFGAYQGHGDYYLSGVCDFVDGTVSGVKMYAYPNNGY